MLDDDDDGALERLRHAKLPNWDGKLVIAAMILAGYFFIMFRMLRTGIPEANMAIVKDQMLVIGPVIGLIAGALFRNTLADERRDASRSADLRQAMATPTLPPAAVQALLPPPAQVQQAVEDGARAGVADGIDRASDGGEEEAVRRAVDEAIKDGVLSGMGGLATAASLSPATGERITIPADGGKEIIS